VPANRLDSGGGPLTSMASLFATTSAPRGNLCSAPPSRKMAPQADPASSGKGIRLPGDERLSVSQTEAYTERLGGFTARERPAFGMRPTLRFAVAGTSTLAYIAFAVWFSEPWRDELGDAIGPIAAWVIPTLLA
jgi:hypothetical protein